MKLIVKLVTGIVVLIAVLLLSFWRADIPVADLKEKYANEESEFLEMRGMQVHYRDEGQGFPLVLIHGTAASLHTWDDWTKILKNDFRVIRMDIPAFGLTGPNPNRDYSIESYVIFLNDFLSQLGIDTFYLAGNSLGGQIAWNYVLTYQDQVKKLILIDAAGFPNKPPVIIKLAQTPLISVLLKNCTPKFVISKNLNEVYGDDTRIREEVVERYYLLHLREGNRQAFIDRVSGNNISETNNIRKISIPTLIQWGVQDEWIPLAHGHKFDELLPDSKLIIYKGAGHIPMEEIPEETARDARNFLLN